MSPTPRRQPGQTCSGCGSWNESTNSRCWNCQLPLSKAEITPFEFPDTGQNIRAVNRDGEPWFVAADVCAVLGIANPSDAVRSLDADEVELVPAALVTTEGRPQDLLNLITESGLYSLILRSRKPEARAFKRWITHDVLPAIRKTGSYAVAALTRRDLAAMVIEEADRADHAEARIAAIAPAADAWEALSQATGDYSVREAAQILDRDPAISTGQNRLFKTMHDIGWIDARSEPYQAQVDLGRLVRRTSTYEHPKTGEPVLYSQIRITAKGLAKLRDVLAAGPDGQLDIGGA